MLQLPGGWPPPAPMSVKGRHSIQPGQADDEGSLRLLVKCQHRGVQQQRRLQEAAAAKAAPEGGDFEGRRLAWTRPRPPPRPPPRGGRRRGMPRRRRASLSQTSRRLEAPGSPTPRRWRGASEWCWLAWTELLSPRSQPAIKKS